MTLKFYMTPGSCSTGIHIMLEELESVQARGREMVSEAFAVIEAVL